MQEISIHLVAQHVHNGLGHHVHYMHDAQRAFEHCGLPVKVYVPHSAEISLPANWVKWFHSFQLGMRLKFFNDCRRLFTPCEKPRVFFLESFGRRDLRLFALAATLFAKKNDSLWILIRGDLTSHDQKSFDSACFSLRWLSFLFKERFVPISDSELMIQFYEKVFHKPIHLLPVLHTTFSHPVHQKKSRLTCAWIGSPRKEKGKERIRNLLRIPDEASRCFELVVSETAEFPKPQNHLLLRPVKGILSKKEYREVMEGSDFILLPYLQERYQWRSSGIFVESILAGKVPLATPGTWMARELLKFGLEELIVDWSRKDLFTYIFRLVPHMGLHSRLARMQRAYKKFHSLETLSGLFMKILNASLEKHTHSNS